MAEFSHIPKEKLRLYFRYLVNAASEIDVPEPKKHVVVKEPRMIELRLEDIPEQRKRQLQSKVDVFFAKDRFSPYWTRLERIEKKFKKLDKKKHSKKKIKKVKDKIKECKKLLKKIEKMNLPS